MARTSSAQILDGIIVRKLSGQSISRDEAKFYEHMMTEGDDEFTPEQAMIRERRIKAKMPTPMESAQLTEQELRNQMLSKQLQRADEPNQSVINASLAEQKRIAKEARDAEASLEIIDKLRERLRATPDLLRGPIAGKAAGYVSSNAQAAEKLSNELMLKAKELNNMGSTGFTESDKKTLLDTVPTLRNFPEAAETILQDFESLALKGINKARTSAGLSPIEAAIVDPETGKPVSREEIQQAAKIHGISEDEVRSELRNTRAQFQAKLNPPSLAPNQMAGVMSPASEGPVPFTTSNITALGEEDLAKRQAAAQGFLKQHGEINNANLPDYLQAVGRPVQPQMAPQGSLAPLMGNQLQQAFLQQGQQPVKQMPLMAPKGPMMPTANEVSAAVNEGGDPQATLAALYKQALQGQDQRQQSEPMSEEIQQLDQQAPISDKEATIKRLIKEKLAKPKTTKSTDRTTR